MPRGEPAGGLVLSLAGAALVHDAMMSFCLTAALTAVIAPLLVLFGLRTGVIEALRTDLVEDPVFREIKPAETQAYSPAFFSRLRGRADVAFVIESIASGASVVRVRSADGTSIAMDMLPTGTGDPLIEGNGLTTPSGAGDIFLSQEAARRLAVRAGNQVFLTAQRTGIEPVALGMAVAGVLPLRADDLVRVYVPLAVAEDIEIYREGFAVPHRGWEGGKPVVPPSFDGVYAVLNDEPDPILRGELALNTGFYNVVRADPKLFAQRLADVFPTDQYVLDLSVIERGADAAALRRVRDRLAGVDYKLLPYVTRPTVTLVDPSGASVEAPIRITTHLPDFASEPPFASYARVTIPSGSGLAVGTEVTLRAQTINGVIEAPVTIVHEHDHETVGIPFAFASLLRRGIERGILYNAETRQIEIARGGYHGFRLYAKSIDDVPELFRDLRAEGIETKAQVQAIERIRALDDGLRKLFWLIAAISVAGAAVVLLSSLYASVERKAGDIAMLRLLGLSRNLVWRFPVFQGMMIAVAGGVAGVSAAWLTAAFINGAVGPRLGFDGAICKLDLRVAAATVAAVLLVALLASLAAAVRATRIEPAEVIRAE